MASATFRVSPNDRRVQALAFALIVVLVSIYLLWFPKPVFAAGPCTYQGFRLYENGSPFNGDYADICSPTLIPTSASRSNFDVNPGPAFLINGCNAGLISHSTWNDCVSGVYIDNLASGFKFQLYQNSNYSGLIFCADGNGDHSYSFGASVNDRASSARIVTGDC